MAWTTPDPARYAPDDVLAAADLNNIEGNLERLADTFRGAEASADLSLTTSYQDIAGATITLTHTGFWFVIANVLYNYDTTDQAASAVLDTQLLVNAVAQTGLARFRSAAAADVAPASQGWLVQVASGPETAKLQAKKSAGGGASSVRMTHTRLFAIWVAA